MHDGDAEDDGDVDDDGDNDDINGFSFRACHRSGRLPARNIHHASIITRQPLQS